MIRAIVTDIEGTTSSLSFVKDVLFPYARKHLREFVAAHKDETAVRQLLQEAKAEADGGLSDDEIVELMLRWIDEDKKVTPLKSLQGMIWEHGYENGDFTGHIYGDAVEGLRQWHAEGIRLYVYSSGSEHAQRLLFGHSDYGDLTPLFTDYFDTHVGHKREWRSYENIIHSLQLPAEEILFLSDIVEELDAARQAGMHTTMLKRGGPLGSTPGNTHTQVSSFEQINLSDWT